MLIGYARVSTMDQSLDLQFDALEKAGCDEIFQDHGISGAKAARPGLESALARLQPGDTLIVWKLDRLGRSVQHLAQLGNWLEERGILFLAISDAIDTRTPIGKFIFHIIAAVAEYERSLMSERTKAGLASARARGVKLGRPKKDQFDDPGQSLDEAAKSFGVDGKPPEKKILH